MWTPTTRAQHSRAGLRYGSDPADAERAVLEPLLPAPCPCGRCRRWPLREVVNAISYVLRCSCPWRSLPKDLPPWRTAHRWFARLRDAGTWEAMNFALVMADRERVGRGASPSAAVMDSQSVRTTEAGGPRGYDAGKKVWGRKRHAPADTDGRALLLRAHPASVQDCDGAVTGFGARRRSGTKVSYVLAYRTAAERQRLITIGRHGSPWTPDTARREALRLLGEVARGGDPMADRRARRSAAATSVADLCDRYPADAAAERLLTRRRTAKIPSTVATDRSRVDAHIRPLLGAVPVSAVTRGDVERMMYQIIDGGTRKRTKLDRPRALSNVRGGRGAASRTVGLLGAVMAYAVRLGLRPDNPVRGVARPADGRRERRLGVDEYAALGAALAAAGDDGVWAPGVAAIRFLLLTGWRSGEALGLRWPEVDLARRSARLADTKTGASTRPLAEAACTVLRGCRTRARWCSPRRAATCRWRGSGGSGPGWCTGSPDCRAT